VVIADGPGSGIILIFSFKHSLISIAPGSEILGVPASDIKEIILFALKSLIIYDNCLTSLNL